MLSIDINCDMGESTHLWPYEIEKDKKLISYVSSINLACGMHAGDPNTMHLLVQACSAAGVAIGAHPSFLDRENFGRTNMDLSDKEIYDLVMYQIVNMDSYLKFGNLKLHHVKPHGALYNMAAKDRKMADAIAKAVFDHDPGLILYALSGSELINAGKEAGLTTCSEVFADRTYQDDGQLTPRTESNALITSTQQSMQQIFQMVQTQSVTSVNGKTVPVVAETICIHSDGQHALSFAKEIRDRLRDNGIEVKSL